MPHHVDLHCRNEASETVYVMKRRGSPSHTLDAEDPVLRSSIHSGSGKGHLLHCKWHQEGRLGKKRGVEESQLERQEPGEGACSFYSLLSPTPVKPVLTTSCPWGLTFPEARPTKGPTTFHYYGIFQPVNLVEHLQTVAVSRVSD